VRYKLTYLFLLFFGGIYFSSEAQDICKNLPANAVKGDFEVIGGLESGCAPLKIELKDNSGGTNIKYEFQYEGKPEASLNITGNTNTSTTYNLPKTYTILQYGKKGGKNMYKCLDINVLKPVTISYSVCNDLLDIEIPKQTIPQNVKISYSIDGTILKSLKNTDLPLISMPRNVNFPAELKYFYTDNNGKEFCEKKINVTKPGTSNNSNLFWAKISKLEMIAPSKVNLTFSGSNYVNGYGVFMSRKNDIFSTLPIKINVTPGTYTYNLPDSTNSYCFYVSKENNCGGTDRSADLCTIPLDTINSILDSNSINWQIHPVNFYNSIVPLPLVFGNRTVTTSIIRKDKSGANTIIDVPNNIEKWTDKIECKNKYCYQIKSISKGELFYESFEGESISFSRCGNQKAEIPPGITEVLISVEDSKNKIVFKDNSNWKLPIEKYILFKKVSNQYLKIDSSIIVKEFIDINSKPNLESEFYKIGYLDRCKNESELSKEIGNVLLKSNNKELLTWSSSIPFGNDSIFKYEVIYYDENSNAPLIIFARPKNKLSDIINYSYFENKAILRLKIYGNSGTESFSNFVTIPITPQFYIPEVFSPNNDFLNDELMVKGKFARVIDFKWEIYNKWGEKIFMTNDKNVGWNGKKHQINIKNTDIFTFILEITLDNQEKIKKAGQIQILK
jgi:gliding motility-associated-like protein